LFRDGLPQFDEIDKALARSLGADDFPACIAQIETFVLLAQGKRSRQKRKSREKKHFIWRGSKAGNKKGRAPVAGRMEVHLSIQQPWTHQKTYQ
jgi:hypothetical protein